MPGSGTQNAVQLKQLAQAVQAAGMISDGRASGFSMGRATVPLAVPLTDDQSNLVQSSIVNASAAVALTSVKAETPTQGNTPASAIQAAANQVGAIASTPGSIQTLEKGTTATLHWWGWTLILDQDATNALKSLLTTDLPGFVAVVTALTTVSAPIGAALAIAKAAETGLSAWIGAENTNNHGVTINGYLWVGIWVTGNA